MNYLLLHYVTIVIIKKSQAALCYHSDIYYINDVLIFCLGGLWNYLHYNVPLATVTIFQSLDSFLAPFKVKWMGISEQGKGHRMIYLTTIAISVATGHRAHYTLIMKEQGMSLKYLTTPCILNNNFTNGFLFLTYIILIRKPSGVSQRWG